MEENHRKPLPVKPNIVEH